MGSADIIPGVSGGTIALITGIYERLVYAIRSIDFKFIFYFFKGFYDRSYFKKARKNFLKTDFALLIPLAIGVFVAFLSLAHLMDYLIINFKNYTYAFFLGLILASAFFVYHSVKKNITIRSLFFVFIGFLVGFLVVGLEQINTTHSFIVIFLAGFISFCAMILPGVSGAFILLVLGQYSFMINVLKKIATLDFTDLSYAILYVAGGAVGLLSFSRVLSFLLKRYHTATLCFVIGLMVGALRSPGEIIVENPENIFLTIASAVFGVFLVSVLYFYSNKFEKTDKFFKK
jgi:putative membrane protein